MEGAELAQSCVSQKTVDQKVSRVMCDEEIWHPNTFDRQRTMVVSKNYRIVAVGEAVSLSHPLYHYKVR